MAITYLEISYPNFVLGSIIDPEEANQNNHDLQTKINDVVSDHNNLEQVATNLGVVKANITYVDGKINDLAGVGRTTQTIKSNFDSMGTHKTSADHDARYYTKALLNSGQLDNRYYTSALLNSGQLDNRYYTKEYLTPWLRGGDTSIKEEVYTITNSNNGDGTFNYSSGSNIYTGIITADGHQVFNLKKGNYTIGSNRIEAIINDTLRRSVASGGLVEVSETSVALTSPEGVGAEITIKYYERLGMTAEYNIKLSAVKPPNNNGKNMWLKIIG